MSRGIVLRDLPGEVPPARLRAALGPLQLCHVPSVRWFSPALDPSELDACAGLGARVASGLGPIHPGRAPDAVELGDGDALRGWHRMIDAAARLGVESLHCTVGVLEDRFGAWAEQLAATAGLVRPLVRAAEAYGIPLVLKTHEEMTTFELLRFAEETGVRVGFSPVNVVVRLEHPLAAARRVAPLVHTVFLEDCAITWTPAGLPRRMRPVGQGAMPWPEILEVLPEVPVVLDLHRAELDMPLYQDGWLGFHPDLTLPEPLTLAAVAGPDEPSTPLGRRCEIGLAAIGYVNRSRTSSAVRPSSSV
ncbi:sugar phosphate isomerase/epimerase family protein [Amycolatopsis thermoflava]|uniref:sugar phosphate isomerase/epimerase family protein n=1 Tax=Amycolatopsis thermoflava TaxID=84480 RepID=UPI003D72340C